MPIADCGFSDAQTLTAQDALTFYGPTILVDIGLDEAFDYRTVGQAPSSQVRSVLALIDTGAVESCIDDALAREIGLPVIDRQSVAGAGGAIELNVYLGHIHIPTVNFTVWGRFTGVLLQAGGQQHQALIGRTMLQNALLVYDGRSGAARLAT
jgi:predicted aspartyl protease